MADSNDNGNPRGTLPKEVWQDLKALLAPDSHFHGTYTLIFSDGKITHTERTTKIRIPIGPSK
jgi:hypothetical protein